MLVLTIALSLPLLGYFLFMPAPTFDITKIKGRPPPGWKIPDVPATVAVPVAVTLNGASGVRIALD